MKTKKGIAALISIFVLFAFFANVENIKSSIISAFEFCISSLIPSVFIFMIISSFFLYSSVLEPLFSFIPEKVLDVLGVCRKYSSHVFLGSLCGFVNGPLSICEEYRKNGGNERDFSNAVILSSNAGIGFLISFVGGSIWESKLYGLYLYVTQIVCSVMLGKLLLKTKQDTVPRVSKLCKSSYSSAVSKAVSSSTTAMLCICGFVVFFSSVSAVITSLFHIETGSAINALLNIFLEFSKGSSSVLYIKNSMMCAFLSGFCIGFGGICVHFQTFAVCEGLPLNKKMFFFFKLIQGLLCGFFSFLYAKAFDLEPSTETFKTTAIHTSPPLASILLIAFVIIFALEKIINYFSKKCIDFSKD